MTPTDSAEKVVAEWRAAMEGVTPGPWRPSRYGFQVVSDYPEPAWQSVVELTTIARSEPNVEREMLAQKTVANWLARCSPSGISGLLDLLESQRATIERQDDELIGERWHADEAARQRDVWKARAEAAEARVTAMEAEKAERSEALDGIYTYCNDTLSGRVDGGPDDRGWQREAVIRARNLARPFARPDIEAAIRAQSPLPQHGGER